MRIFGYVMIAVGVIWGVIALNMDTTVVTAYGMRVNNIGLMSSRQTQTIVAGFITLIGVIVAVSGRAQKPPVNLVKCPFCAEDIQRDAIKCKHCNSDLSQSGKGDGGSSTSNGYMVTTPQGDVDIDALAHRFVAEMPGYTPGVIMITNMPAINKITSSMKKNEAREFEELLEARVKELLT